MHAIDEGGVVIDLRQVLEQVGLPDHVPYVVTGVSHEGEGRLGRALANSAAEALVRHVVLQDVHDVTLRLLPLSGEFVERHAVPEADQADLPGGVVEEELCGRHVAA